MSPAVPVKDQSLAAGKHSAAEADFSPTKRREAVVGGETWTRETLGQEGWECLRCELTSWTAEARVTSVWWKSRGEIKKSRKYK